MIRDSLTASVLEAEVGEPPDVAEADGVGDAAHGEVELGVPDAPLGRQAARVATVASADHVAALVQGDDRRVVGGDGILKNTKEIIFSGISVSEDI